ncbi:MAG: AAA family ATPase [Verrucomicrobiae bacterium]|nr:AAA family ATPase [Verrucomicrobiae bacterium]
MITRLQVENFKSFGSEMNPLSLRPLNFVVGANASGKTNLLSALRFLKIALLQNVEIAVGEFEGPGEVRNKIQRERKEAKPVRLLLRIDGAKLGTFRRVKAAPLNVRSFDYLVEIDVRSNDEEPLVLRENLGVVMVEATEGSETELRYRMERTRSEVILHDGIFRKTPTESIPIEARDSSRLAAGAAFLSPPLVLFRDYIEGWSFYNISPSIARQPCKEVPELALGESGEFLAAILHKLEKQHGDEGSLDQILNGLRGAVPGFKSVRTKPLEVEGKWTFQVVEDRIRGAINPRSVSDGTIRLLALMVIAHWSARRSTLLAIEEPENGLHPHLSGHIVELLRTASETRQVLVTTHNPDFLDELEPEEVLLCDKAEGFTVVRHASEVAEIKSFRKHFRLGELWEQGTLGGIP